MIPKEVIDIAKEGGYHNVSDWVIKEHTATLILDPLFWQSLGNALGWSIEQWFDRAHDFLDLLLTGGDTEKFWQDFIKPN